jgi:hypothetical protein
VDSTDRSKSGVWAMVDMFFFFFILLILKGSLFTPPQIPLKKTKVLLKNKLFCFYFFLSFKNTCPDGFETQREILKNKHMSEG